MPRHAARARSGFERTSLYDDITTKIITELEAGRVPWVQPWGNGGGEGAARHAEERRHRPELFGDQRADPLGVRDRARLPVQGWVTFRQALSIGANVRKREHGTTVMYADRFAPDDDKKRAQETGEEARAIPFLKRFTVFNWRGAKGCAKVSPCRAAGYCAAASARHEWPPHDPPAQKIRKAGQGPAMARVRRSFFSAPRYSGKK
jgi:antirestriction protein ArdC